MIDMVQKFMREDATEMETYTDLCAVVYEFKHCKGIFARNGSYSIYAIHVTRHLQTLRTRSKYWK